MMKRINYSEEENEILQSYKQYKLMVSKKKTEDIRRANRTANNTLNQINKLSIQLKKT